MLGLSRTELLLIGLGLAGVGTAIFWPDSPTGPASDGSLRGNALALLELYLPATRGDAHFAEMTKNFGGVGTTCGYLPSFLLYRIGVRDARIVNRVEPDIPANNTQNTIGQNISKLVFGGQALGAYHLLSSGRVPQPADIGYFGAVDANGGVTKEHVAVLKSYPAGGTGTIVTYDLGHSIQPEGSMSTRTMQNGVVNFMGAQRNLIGFVDLSALPRVAASDFTDHTALVA